MAKDKSNNKELTKKTAEGDKEFANPDLPIEGTKDQSEESSSNLNNLPARETVRGEDVLKIMRAKGVKI